MRDFAKRKTMRLHGGFHNTRAQCSQQREWDAHAPEKLAKNIDPLDVNCVYYKRCADCAVRFDSKLSISRPALSLMGRSGGRGGPPQEPKRSRGDFMPPT